MAAKRQRLQLVDDFATRLARRGLSLRAFANHAEMNYTTLHGLVNPDSQPTRRGGSGGMYLKTAWRIAGAYAACVGITPDKAFDEIITKRSDVAA